MSRIKRVVLFQPASAGGNFEYVAIPRQGLLFLSGALAQWEGPNIYEREIWFEDRSGLMDPDKDLEGVNILMVTALINEAPRGYQIAKLAKQFHPEIITIGGGPQMSPLAEEAFNYGDFDVIVNREGEDIIGQLSDVLLERSIKDLDSTNPMVGAVIETIRGCTENCTYCQVIQQFLGYRMISRENEFKRLAQLRELAADGLIHTAKNGTFQVFISDDLHTPPKRAVKFRDDRFARLQGWKEHTEGMNMICQVRAEVGQDPELISAMQDANIKMVYVGVESDNAENLLAVNKRQEPGQMHNDLRYLNDVGLTVVAMTIIGLPFDTEKSIMDLAEWVTTVSKYQTVNFLTPLPATSNWDSLVPLDENGDLLPEGVMRPYHLYTGRQFVHKDKRWTMQESRDLFDRYSAKLNPVDDVYRRIFRILRTYKLRLAATSRDLSDTLASRLSEATEALKTWSDSASLTSLEFGENITERVNELVEQIRSVSQPLANTRKDAADAIGNKVNELSDSLAQLTGPSSNRELAINISGRITELTDLIDETVTVSSRGGAKK